MSRLLIALVFVAMGVPGQFIIRVPPGKIYYVRTDGNNSNDGVSNTSGRAWLTIDFAADHVAPGDIVRVQAGTYVEVATPNISGTSGRTVTLVADGVVTTCGMSFSSKNYIRVIGFTMDGSVGGCSLTGNRLVISGTNIGLEFWNNNLDNSDNSFIININDRCNACIVMGGSIHHVNNSANGLTMTGNDSFVGYVDFATICYLGVVPSGNRLRFVNLNFSGLIQCSISHPDFFYIQGLNTLGYSDNLVESTFGIGTPTSNDNKFQHVQPQVGGAWVDNVWRFNVGHNTGSASLWSMYNVQGGLSRWKYYANTLVYGDEAVPNAVACGNIDTPGDTVYIYNTIFFRCWNDLATTGIAPWNTSPGTRVADYNLAFDDGGAVSFVADWTNQVHEQSNVDPQLVNVSADDFTLGASSGARGTGGPLTTTNGSGVSSTSLTVATDTGSFFLGSNASNLPQYGGALVPGDVITVGSTTVQVTSRSGDTLTLASPLSWNNGDPVYFGSSTTIDIGAYPYKSGGYALSATYAVSNGIATITPTDASLVRFVVCYANGIPTTVDNSSPYTCPVVGLFEARVYPRYPSTTLWAVASSQ